MTSFLLVKLIRTGLTVLLALCFTFFLMRMAGDPALAFLGVDAPPEALALFREKHGLDQPVLVQFGYYLSNLAQGDFGTSLRDGRSVTTVVFEVVPRTIQLMALGFAVSMLIGLPAGMIAAIKRDQWVDRLVMAGSVIGFSLPNFLLGLLLLLVFTLWLRVLPSGGASGPASLVMPTITLATAFIGIVARYTRSSMLAVLDRPFLRAARARGLSGAEVILKHALPNAAIPIVTVSGLIFGSLLGGASVAETVFSWPGMGRLLVSSVLAKDFPVIQFIVIILALAMIATNLLVDIMYGVLDPRIGSQVREGSRA
ncbi:ABC transporter permease [Pelagibacterium sp. H642]|uniref:ABC transporter permease n=1 Tax=Pelagibacterium sp. H642 TaxID=1881069 RepID=UPI0028163AE8|nr:ABC transporter permease [Pelagibacterium sp. H642]WMT92552.1 ABC transporter permease [Pelagibacterium sp. H642]